MAEARPYSIVPAQVKDIPILQEIEISAAQRFADSAYPELADGRTMDIERYQKLFDENAPIFLARADQPDNQRNVRKPSDGFGFAVAAPLDNGLHLHEISVRFDMQGQGIGRDLLAHILAHAQAETYARVSLTTYLDIGWNAPFYMQAGFHIVPEPKLPASLKSILDHEIAHGACAATRCAMVYSL